jgi:hypothetical protein
MYLQAVSTACLGIRRYLSIIGIKVGKQELNRSDIFAAFLVMDPWSGSRCNRYSVAIVFTDKVFDFFLQ